MKSLAAAGLLAAALMATPAAAVVDVDALWNFADPAASEQRFRTALDTAQGDDVLILRSQIARTYGLRGRFDDAHAELDAIARAADAAGAEPRVRVRLERGRTLRSAGRTVESRPYFQQAFDVADRAGLDVLATDALHMLALVADGLDARLQANQRALEHARRAADPLARRWEGPILNNLGNDLREAGRWAESLAMFRDSQAAYARSGRAGGVRLARWQVANVLRLMGRADEALALQLTLEDDLAAIGAPDPHVFDELALLHAARGDAARAAHYRALKAALGDKP